MATNFSAYQPGINTSGAIIPAYQPNSLINLQQSNYANHDGRVSTLLLEKDTDFFSKVRVANTKKSVNQLSKSRFIFQNNPEVGTVTYSAESITSMTRFAFGDDVAERLGSNVYDFPVSCKMYDAKFELRGSVATPEFRVGYGGSAGKSEDKYFTIQPSKDEDIVEGLYGEGLPPGTFMVVMSTVDIYQILSKYFVPEDKEQSLAFQAKLDQWNSAFSVIPTLDNVSGISAVSSNKTSYVANNMASLYSDRIRGWTELWDELERNLGVIFHMRAYDSEDIIDVNGIMETLGHSPKAMLTNKNFITGLNLYTTMFHIADKTGRMTNIKFDDIAAREKAAGPGRYAIAPNDDLKSAEIPYTKGEYVNTSSILAGFALPGSPELGALSATGIIMQVELDDVELTMQFKDPTVEDRLGWQSNLFGNLIRYVYI